MNKNIALYCVPRSGSSSLYNCILSHLDKSYVGIWEPFNHIEPTLKIENPHIKLFDMMEKSNGEKKLFLKMMMGQKDPYTKQLDWDNFIFSKLHKLVFLTRNNKKEATESLLFHQTIGETNYHSKKYYDTSIINKIDMEMREAMYNMQETFMQIYSREYGYPIFTYEEIFVDKNMDRIYEIFEYLEIKPNDKLIEKYIISDEFKVRLGNIEDKPTSKLI